MPRCLNNNCFKYFGVNKPPAKGNIIGSIQKQLCNSKLPSLYILCSSLASAAPMNEGKIGGTASGECEHWNICSERTGFLQLLPAAPMWVTASSSS